jgi:hypothetical protein
LQLTGSLPGRLFIALEERSLDRIESRQVLGQPGPGPVPEFFNGLSNHRRRRIRPRVIADGLLAVTVPIER